MLALALCSLGGPSCSSDDGRGSATAPAPPPLPIVSAAEPPREEVPLERGEVVRKKAPLISGRTLDGRDNVAVYPGRGEVVLLHFWATWCIPCKKSMLRLDELQKANLGKVRVIGLSVDDDPSAFAEFLAELPVQFALAWDRNLETANRYAPKTMPATFVIDRTGTVRFELEGFKDGDEVALAKRVKALL